MIILKILFTTRAITRHTAATVGSERQMTAPMNENLRMFPNRCENNRAKAPQHRDIFCCRVGIGYLLAECLPELRLLFVNVQMDKV